VFVHVVFWPEIRTLFFIFIAMPLCSEEAYNVGLWCCPVVIAACRKCFNKLLIFVFVTRAFNRFVYTVVMRYVIVTVVGAREIDRTKNGAKILFSPSIFFVLRGFEFL